MIDVQEMISPKDRQQERDKAEKKKGRKKGKKQVHECHCLEFAISPSAYRKSFLNFFLNWLRLNKR